METIREDGIVKSVYTPKEEKERESHFNKMRAFNNLIKNE